MGDAPRRPTREFEALVQSARQMLDRLLSQAQLGKADPKLIAQRLTALRETFDKLLEERKQSVENERLARLYKVSRMIGASLDPQTVLEQVMDAIIQLTHAERGFLMLLEENELKTRIARHFDQETLGDGTATVSRTVTNRVLENGQAILTTNAQEDPRFAGQASVVMNSLLSIMAAPLRAQDAIIGVIYVDNRAQAGIFSSDDLILLEMFAEQAAIAINNAVQVREREEALRAQIAELQIVIDEVKKQRQVNEIVDSQYFQELRTKARELRMRHRADSAEE